MSEHNETVKQTENVDYKDVINRSIAEITEVEEEVEHSKCGCCTKTKWISTFDDIINLLTKIRDEGEQFIPRHVELDEADNDEHLTP